ncbi:hypothetical protein DPMN_118736 [Dreissena polymorpha]|uniref:CCHC-type domain-containing protein n=2 Tax=Dreissena polymorpha TaxID=45954 RepID=A0A9D4JM07_DREPO|nr:hypothetical protein DPMN_118736 [Dreissena polymorpha]
MPALTGDSLRTESLERTVKAQGKRGCSMQGVVNVLMKNGVSDTDIEWLASGPPGSSQYDVTFKTKDKCISFLNRIQMQSSVSHQGVQYRFVKYGKQIVSCRIHWLPAFVNDKVIADIFEKFGTVMSVEYDSLKIGDFSTHSGVRVVTVECDRVQQESIPHIIQFECGTRALITMRGRQPLCLYCQEVGHVRNTCPQNINAIFKEKVSVSENNKDNTPEKKTDGEKQTDGEKRKETEKHTDQPAQKKIDDEGFETVGSKKKGKSQGRKKNGENIQEMDVETENDSSEDVGSRCSGCHPGSERENNKVIQCFVSFV